MSVEGDPPNPLSHKEVRPTMTWQFGIVADRVGHVHLGAVVAGSAYRRREYLELLAPVGAAPPAELDLEHLVVLVRGQDIADLRRLVEQCIDDGRLRRRLIELIDLAAPPARRMAWAA